MVYTYKAKKGEITGKGVMVFECDDCKRIYLTKNGIKKHVKYYCRVAIGKRALEKQGK